MNSSNRFNSYDIFYDKTKNVTFNTDGCLIEVTAWAGLTVHSKMKNTNYHTIGRVTKSNSKLVERGNINTAKAQMNDLSLSLLGTGSSI